MAKIITPSKEFAHFKSIQGVMTCVKDKNNNYSVKKYSKPYPFSSEAYTEVKANIETKRVEWNALNQGEKDAWQVIADELFMSGDVLYKSEGFKEGMTSICNDAICNQSYVG